MRGVIGGVVGVLMAASAQAGETAQCGALVHVHEVVIALARPCVTGEAYTVSSDDFTLTLTPSDAGALLEIGPRNLVFLNGESEVMVPLPSEGARLGIFDSFSASYVAEGDNEPVGYLTGWAGVGQDAATH